MNVLFLPDSSFVRSSYLNKSKIWRSMVLHANIGQFFVTSQLLTTLPSTHQINDKIIVRVYHEKK